MIDLLIIGAGLAGLTAAISAAQAGQKVEVVAKGLGALHWSAGTLDVLGYYPDAKSRVERPLESVRQLTTAQALHPYAFCNVAEELKRFAALTHELGLPYLGTDKGENMWLPSPVGAARPTFLAPQAQLAGDLSRAEPMLIVGLRGMRDFFPELIAENLSKQGQRARAAFLPLDLVTARHDINTVQIAAALDDPARRSALAVELKKLVQPGERIGLPAVLGLDAHVEVMRDVEAQSGAYIFEIPTLPPSVPGIRLNSALRKHLQKLGVRVDVNMPVERFHSKGRRVEWIETEASARPLRHHAAKFLLATGGMLGGGIDSDHSGKVWETVFGLPLTAPSERVDWFRPRFLDSAGHPIFHAGVSVNSEFQPVDEKGACVFENVWAAGGVLAHADPILERSLEGIAIATGQTAARCTSRCYQSNG
jgi:glycerol-3-phosphate dehydrogenase subunit B